MRLVRDFERRLEQLVDGVAGRMFRGKLHPVELAARLVREGDLSVEEGPAGPEAANVFVLRLNPRDLDAEIPAALTGELEDLLESTAADRGWRLEGPVRVSLESDGEISRGTVGCRIERAAGERRPWGYLIEGNGNRHALRYNRCIIGRGLESDVSIGDPGVSRTHALVWREGGEIWLRDMGSVNGTQVDGESFSVPARLSTGTVVAFGPAVFSYRDGL
jgi:hypothetical protein